LRIVGGCGWFISGWLIITIQIRSCNSSTFTNRSLHRFRCLTSTCSRIVRTSIYPKMVKTKMWKVLLVGTGWTWVVYYGDPTMRLCRALCVLGLVFKRWITTIWYGKNTDEQLSQPVLYPEEPVNELAYILHSHQTAKTVSICTT
jgi:hypothetical protein